MAISPLFFVVAMFCPRLGSRPGDTVSFDLDTSEIVLVRRMTCTAEQVRAATNSGHLIPLDDDGALPPPPESPRPGAAQAPPVSVE